MNFSRTCGGASQQIDEAKSCLNMMYALYKRGLLEDTLTLFLECMHSS